MELPHISFEFFPPKSEAGLSHLLDTAEKLAAFNPAYFSVTFGAAGSAQANTAETVLAVNKKTGIQTAPHISCVAADKANIKNLLELYISNNINKLVVLRGDLPANSISGVISTDSHFKYAFELIRYIRELSQDHFHISVACYPEFHPETTDYKHALFHFKEKVDAGANSAITQYFYNADAYFKFMESCQKLNIHIPVTPGIMPITNYEKLMQFSKACGAEIPRWLLYRLESYKNDLVSIQSFGEEVVSHLCEQLIAGGAPGLHFYTLNKPDACIHILNRLSSIIHTDTLL